MLQSLHGAPTRIVRRDSHASGIDSDDEDAAVIEHDDHFMEHGLGSSNTMKTGSDTYTTAQKSAGAKEMKEGYDKAYRDRNGLRTPENPENVLRMRTAPSSKQASSKQSRSRSKDDDNSDNLSVGLGPLNALVTGPLGPGCFGDTDMPQDWLYTVTWVVTGLVMALLKYVFCVVGAVIIHDSHPLLSPSLAVGVGIQCSSTLITGLITSRWSKIGVNVSGPDIIASLFVSAWVKTLCEPQDGRAAILTQEEALPTVLFFMVASTFLMGLIWLAIGKFHLTKMVEFMPAPVVCGFLSCIGWKVLKYATKVSSGSAWYSGWTDPWSLLLTVPGVFMGVPLYLLKKYHIGDPMIILPFFMIAPIVIFYIAFASGDRTMDELREDQWLFPRYEGAHFYQVWSEVKVQHINFSSLPYIAVDMCIMIIILIIDSLLKLASTKTALKIDVDMVHEMKVTGYENLIGSLFMASPGYPQVKFNVLSYGILSNTKERRVAYMVALFGGLMWFLGSTDFMLIHYLPRFYLGGLLWYAACPFLVGNLVETYFHMEPAEWVIVVVIFGTVVVADLLQSSAAMLIAVCHGGFWATILFMVQYARVSVIREDFDGACSFVFCLLLSPGILPGKCADCVVFFSFLGHNPQEQNIKAKLFVVHLKMLCWREWAHELIISSLKVSSSLLVRRRSYKKLKILSMLPTRACVTFFLFLPFFSFFFLFLPFFSFFFLFFPFFSFFFLFFPFLLFLHHFFDLSSFSYFS